MKCKEGVTLLGLHPAMRKAMQVADAIWEEETGNEAVCTGAVEGNHSKWSWHTHGCAIDLRIWGLSAKQLRRMRIRFSSEMRDRAYQFIIERDHVHIEWDWDIAVSDGRARS